MIHLLSRAALSLSLLISLITILYLWARELRRSNPDLPHLCGFFQHQRHRLDDLRFADYRKITQLSLDLT